ncbi:MAG: NADH-quinone oxidoreductase subunit D [Candidatus Dormibacteraceae bacterium]
MSEPTPAVDAGRSPRAGERGLVRTQGPLGSGAELLQRLDDPAQGGRRLLDLWAWQDGDRGGLELLLGAGEELLWHSMPLPETLAYPALGHLSAAAAWLESDLGASGAAHPVPPGDPNPDRALRGDPVPPLRDVEGTGLFTIPFGPVRSGVVESMRYDVATAGEDMIRVAARPGSKHRALERRLTEVSLDLVPLVAERIAGVYSTSVAAAACRAVESTAGAQVAPEAEAVRVALIELERVFNHLDVLMKLCDDASLAVGVAQVGILKERVLRLLARSSGHRYGRGVVVLGGVRRGLDWSALRQELPRFERDLHRVQRRLLRTNSLLDRFQRTGALRGPAAAALGAAGPVARGSQLPWDARSERPWPLYRELDVRPAVMADTDVMARFEVRLAEMRESLRLLGLLVVQGSTPPPPAAVRPDAGRAGVGSAETPEGEWLISAEMGEEGRLRRCRVRPASILNFACFEVACRGWVLTDFAFIEHSFGLSIAGRDR